MADNSSRAISEIKVGDEVMAVDSDGGLVPKLVTEIFEYPAQKVVLLNDIRVTLEHPFLVARGVLKELKNIAIGEALTSAEGTFTQDWTLTPVEDQVVVYNLEVEGLHTFVAGGFRVGDNIY